MFYVFCHGSCASWDYRPHLWPKLTAAHQPSKVGAPIETTSNTYNGEIKYYQSQLHCDFDHILFPSSQTIDDISVYNSW